MTEAETIQRCAVELLNITPAAAKKWYENEVIPAFSMTAQQVVAEGHGDAVIKHLKRISKGGYA